MTGVIPPIEMVMTGGLFIYWVYHMILISEISEISKSYHYALKNVDILRMSNVDQCRI